MALDPRISLGVQPVQMPDPLAQYGKVAAIQQAQNQNALAQYQLSAAQRADEQSTNRLRLFQEAGGDPTKVSNALLQTGDTKGYAEFAKSQAEAGKTRAETIAKHMALSKERLATVRSPEDYIAWHQENHADPVLADYFKSMGITAESQTQKIMQQLQQPGGFQALFAQSALGLDKAMEQTLTSQNLGGTTQVLSTPKYALPGTAPKATVVPGSVSQVTMAPGEAERIAIARGQLGVSQAGLALRQQELAQQRDPEHQKRMAYAKATGEAMAKGDVTAIQQLPKVVDTVEKALTNIDAMVGKEPVKDPKTGKVIQPGTAPHPGFSDVVGATWKPGMRFVQGSNAANFDALYEQVMGEVAEQAYEAIRGAGAITKDETKFATAARTRMSKAQSEDEFVKAAREYQGVLRKGVERLQTRVQGVGGGAAPASPATPGVIDFGSLR